jgi:deoxyribodipyrimidine photo-lyase
MTVIHWFKRDLRLADNPALSRAAALGPVLPLYIVEPELWQQPDASGRQWGFVAESLQSLDHDLARHGLRLILRTGDAVAVLSELCARYGIARIVSQTETGNLWTYARDRRVAAWAKGAGVAWEEVPGTGVVRRLPSRDGWAARRDAFVAAPVLPVPRMTGVNDVDPGYLPDAASLRLPPDPCLDRQSGGRGQGTLLLQSFLETRGQTYRAAMSSPVTGATACSRLSPHLAWGTLSVREVAQATSQRQFDRPGPIWAGSLSSFKSRLAWRDHFIQKLEDEPEIETRCLHRAAEALRPRDPDPVRLAAWTKGEIGLPFVDACMRYLTATGWLNFRMRSMVMAVASYHLWLDWRATGPVLARLFTDYEPGIHWPQVQMQSGTTGINTIRIYNPVKQGLDQDPTGAFTRRWVPELAAVPDAFLQEPWHWEGAARLRYPAPIVDVAASQRAARDAVWALCRDPAHRAEAAGIVAKHASRKDGTGRFVNDREGTRKRRDGRQLSFDL